MTLTDAPILAALASSKQDSLGHSVCPLRQMDVQLLPLRYAVVNQLDPSCELSMPYSLSSRPLGLRPVRDGWLYLFNSQTARLDEFRLHDGHISRAEQPVAQPHGLDGAHLIYPRSSTLWVCYCEVQWTAQQLHTAVASREDRERYMHKVELSRIDIDTGAKDLLTPQQAERWVEELAAPPQRTDLELPEHEAAHYFWADPPGMPPLHPAALKGSVLAAYENDYLYLVVRDDLSVLRDLAQMQDTVEAWVQDWATGGTHKGENERDYLLACYIESLTLVTSKNLVALFEATDNAEVRSMFVELDQMPLAQREATVGALLDYLNRWPEIARQPVTPELVERHEAYRLSLTRSSNSLLPNNLDGHLSQPYFSHALQNINERYFTTKHFLPIAPPFAEHYLEALLTLARKNDQAVKDRLKGAEFGQRGIDDLIDRPAMDKCLAEARRQLSRWNDLQERITADRLQLITQDLYFDAAWGFDSTNLSQLQTALAAQYACMRDICRTEEATKAIQDWSHEDPRFGMPLLYTLPLSHQTQALVMYNTFTYANYTLFTELRSYVERWEGLLQKYFPLLVTPDQHTKDLLELVNAPLKPAQGAAFSAVSDAVQSAPEAFLNPDRLFERLPAAWPGYLLETARQNQLVLVAPDENQRARFQQDLSDYLHHKENLGSSVRMLEFYKARPLQYSHHHQMEAAAQIEHSRTLARLAEQRLGYAILPISENMPMKLVHEPYVIGRVGLRIKLPEHQASEIRGLVKNAMAGLTVAPKVGVIGDGVAFFVFIAQLTNFLQIYNESQDKTEPDTLELLAASSSAAINSASAVLQGILNTGLLSQYNLWNTHSNPGLRTKVQLGKLHLSLGLFTYGSGIVGASINLKTQQKSWIAATRSGNGARQLGAGISMIAAMGQLGTQAYGATVTLKNLAMAVTAAPTDRIVALAAAGLRLSSIFIRTTWIGLAFWFLELAGTWIRNRYNQTALDRWLMTTPWGEASSEESYTSWEKYQTTLRKALVQPSAHIVSRDASGALPAGASGNVMLNFRGLTLGQIWRPLAGSPACLIKLIAHKVRPVYKDRAAPTYEWTVVTNQVMNSLKLSQALPLQFTFDIGAAPSSQLPKHQILDHFVLEILIDFTLENLETLHYLIKLPLFQDGPHLADPEIIIPPHQANPQPIDQITLEYKHVR